MNDTERVQEVLRMITEFGNEDGAHHKQWLLDQIVRTLTEDKYADWRMGKLQKDGGQYYDGWDEGIAP